MIREGRGVISLRKRTVLKIAVGSVLVCIFILALMYPLISASYKDKIYFLMSPNPVAIFYPPVSENADSMYVWVSVVKHSPYGSFTTAMVGYQTYHADNNNDYYEYDWHWYTTNLKAGETLAYLTMRVNTLLGDVMQYDVSVARIDVTKTEHQLNATVIVRGETLFSVGFWADTGESIESRIEPTSPASTELYLSVEAYRPILEASVTGIEIGDFWHGRFDYIDTELFDSSLLP